MTTTDAQKESNKKYVQSIIRKQLVINPKKDPDLLAAIWAEQNASDDFVFCDLVRELLRKHYGVKELESNYTQEKFISLVDSTKLDASDFCEKFKMNKGTYNARRTKLGTMKAYDWSVLVKEVSEYLNDIA